MLYYSYKKEPAKIIWAAIKAPVVHLQMPELQLPAFAGTSAHCVGPRHGLGPRKARGFGQFIGQFRRLGLRAFSGF